MRPGCEVPRKDKQQCMLVIFITIRLHHSRSPVRLSPMLLDSLWVKTHSYALSPPASIEKKWQSWAHIGERMGQVELHTGEEPWTLLPPHHPGQRLPPLLCWDHCLSFLSEFCPLCAAGFPAQLQKVFSNPDPPPPHHTLSTNKPSQITFPSWLQPATPLCPCGYSAAFHQRPLHAHISPTTLVSLSHFSR